MNFFKKHKIISIAIIVALIIGGYYWYKKSNTGNAAVQYKTQAAQKGTLTSSILGSGNVIVDDSANIDPTISGTVTNLSVAVGDQVKKGQLLFNIDNDDLGVNVQKAYASYIQSLGSLETAKATRKQASLDYKDGDSKQKSTLKQKVEAAEAGITSAEENVKAALKNYQNEKSNAAESKVTSPIDGTVNAINIKNGDDLSKLSSGSSRTVPIIIGDLNTLKAQIQVNEVDISNVKIGQKATMTFSGIDGLTVSGKVEKMDSLGTLTSGVVTFNVTIDFDTLDPRIKPEMSVSASIVTDVKQNVLLVPMSAVKTRGGVSSVQVLSGQTPEMKKVETGLSNENQIEILSGINAGDKVVTQTINSSTSNASSSNSNSSNRNRDMHLPGM